jgi:dipeptidyl-peptidase-4
VVVVAGSIYVVHGARMHPLYYADSLSASSVRGGVSGDGSALDVSASSCGGYVFAVLYNQLFVVSVWQAGGSVQASLPVQLTSSPTPLHTNGVPDFLGAEEMDLHRGYWLDPTVSHVAYLAVSNHPVPPFTIQHDGDGCAAETHYYPFAGCDNPGVELRILDLRDVLEVLKHPPKHPPKEAEGRHPPEEALPAPVTVIPPPSTCYIPRVTMISTGVISLHQSRSQTSVYLQYTPFDDPGHPRLLHKTTSEHYVNLHHHLRLLPTKNFSYVEADEGSGFMHLYRHSVDSVSKVPITQGEWQVDKIVQVDYKRDRVFFECNVTDARDKVLCAARLSKPSPVIRLTPRNRVTSVTMDGAISYATLSWSDVSTPTTVEVATLRTDLDLFDPANYVTDGDGDNYCAAFLTPLHTMSTVTKDNLPQHFPDVHESLRPPEMVTFANRSLVPLHMAVYLPDPAVHGPGPYPLLISVYGGPHVQRVANNFAMTNDLRSQRLRDSGYIVAKIDNRGSSRRGVAFETAIKHDMGNLEVDDQADAVAHLVQNFEADSKRVGILGWSYGGYMSLACLMREPGLFHVAIAGAPVTSWDGYDTHYTERYMSTPALNPGGYHSSSILTHVPNMSSDASLLLIHGLIDENVHFRHTSRLITKLIQNKKKYDLLLFPEERHSPRKIEDRVYMEDRIFEYLEKNLKGRDVGKKDQEIILKDVISDLEKIEFQGN